MRVAFTYNVRHETAGLDEVAQAEAEFDEPATIAAIHDAIEANGHTCIDVEADEDAFETLRGLRSSIDLVFNIAEGRRGQSREAQMPAMLEMLDIPFSHSGSLTHAIGLDKALTKKVWRFHGLPTPRFLVFHAGTGENVVDALRFPVLVKPNAEGSSKGLFNGNLIEDPADLLPKVEEIRSLVGVAILAEEFMPGREFTVTVMGTPGVGDGLIALPIVEQDYDAFPPELPHFASYEVKWFFEDGEAGLHACLCPADLTPSLRDEIEQLAMQAFTALGCEMWRASTCGWTATGVRNSWRSTRCPGCTTTRSRPRISRSRRAPRGRTTRGIGEVLVRTITRVDGAGPTDRARSTSARSRVSRPPASSRETPLSARREGSNPQPSNP